MTCWCRTQKFGALNRIVSDIEEITTSSVNCFFQAFVGWETCQLGMWTYRSTIKVEFALYGPFKLLSTHPPTIVSGTAPLRPSLSVSVSFQDTCEMYIRNNAEYGWKAYITKWSHFVRKLFLNIDKKYIFSPLSTILSCCSSSREDLCKNALCPDQVLLPLPEWEVCLSKG